MMQNLSAYRRTNMQALSIKQLSKTYAGGTQALKGIDLTVEQGDFFALLGPNGAGKSTTIGIVSSLINKTSGQVEVFGLSLDTQLEAAKRQIGLVPQEFNFNQFETVKQIIVNQAGYYGIARAQAKKRAQEVLETLSLWDKADARSRELSGGMKRRLMIARALVHEPKLLILDEPTAGVDIEIRRSMWKFLRELNENGTTIVLTTHYLEEAEQLCRNIAIINHGQIVENTTVKALLAKLDVQTFVFDVSAKNQPELNLDNYELRWLDENCIEVDIRNGQALNPLFNFFDQHQIEVSSLRNKTNRLEELFIRLVEKKESVSS